MKYRLINFPRCMPIERYDRIIEKVCHLLTQQEGIVSIYRIGSIGNPGISDIDLVAVFKDGVKCEVDPLAGLDKDERPAFAHPVFGIGEGFFKNFHNYSLFKDFSWHWGAEFELNAKHNDTQLKKQVALEYLLANYIARTRDKIYGILSVRNLLLSCNAIRYDLELMDVRDGGLYDNIRELKKMRHNWFDYKYSNKEIQTWFESFYSNLSSFLIDYFRNNRLFVPGIRDYKFSRNIYIIPGNSLEYTFKGIIIPAFISRFHKKLRKINDLVNRFDVYVPMTDSSAGKVDLLAQRDVFSKRMLERHKKNFPYFAPLANNLQMKFFV